MEAPRPLPLLVNLRELVYDSRSCLDVTQFLGPKLSRFSIVNGRASVVHTSALVSIKTLVPNLEHLCVKSSFSTCALGRTACEVVCSLHHLRSLNLTSLPLTSACITHLSTLPNLRQLSATITADSRIQTASSRNLFPALVRLDLSADSWPLVIDFLTTYIQDLPLRDFHCCIEKFPTSDHLDQLFGTLRKCCLPNSVREIELFRPLGTNYPLALSVLDPNSIRRLLAFPNLESLAIFTPISFEDIDKTLIGEIASAWPHLTTLEFPRLNPLTMQTKVTICGLRQLADQCTNLKTLAIDLDPAVPDTHVRLKPDGSFYDTSLAWFSVGYSRMKDPVAVASFLADVFPNLSRVDAWDNDMGSDREMEEGTDAYLCNKVDTLYRALVAARRRERLHVSQSAIKCNNDSR
jgi:hypothetical protein